MDWPMTIVRFETDLRQKFYNHKSRYYLDTVLISWTVTPLFKVICIVHYCITLYPIDMCYNTYVTCAYPDQPTHSYCLIRISTVRFYTHKKISEWKRNSGDLIRLHGCSCRLSVQADLWRKGIIRSMWCYLMFICIIRLCEEYLRQGSDQQALSLCYPLLCDGTHNAHIWKL
jgi:hypothetical protein